MTVFFKETHIFMGELETANTFFYIEQRKDGWWLHRRKFVSKYNNYLIVTVILSSE